MSAPGNERSTLLTGLMVELVETERNCSEMRRELERALDPSLPAVSIEHLALTIRPLIETLCAAVEALLGVLLDLGLDDESGGGR